MFESFLGVNPWTSLFILLNTLTIFFVARHFLFVPVMKIIEDRQAEIDSLYADAGSAKENALALESEYRHKLSTAATTSEQMVKEAVARGQAREEDILRRAHTAANAILEKANANIAMEKKKAINDAKDEISCIAIAIAEKVVGRELNQSDHCVLVDSFINGLGDSI